MVTGAHSPGGPRRLPWAHADATLVSRRQAGRLHPLLVCFDAPRDNVSLRGLRGLRNGVKRVTVLGTGTELGHHVTGGLGAVPGVTWIDAPAAADLDEYATVLAVELEGELDLYRGAGRG